jgi:Na+-transporting NADH:ubiquinone oxidoreductase subunit A
VSGFSSAPLAPDYSILLKGLGAELQVGVDALKKMTGVTIHVNVPSQNVRAEELSKLQNVQINTFEGKHPCGNVSVQIEKLDPINKGERVWYLDAQDLVVIGRLFLEGKYNTDRLVALTGQEVSHPQYYKVKKGANISSLIYNNTTAVDLRIISGNVLSGTKIEKDGFISAYDNQVTIIKEGNEAEFMGWLAPGTKKFSFSRTFLAGFLTNCCNRKYEVNTNLHGGRRPFVVTGEFEKVFPMDIYPMQLIKACIIEDIDMMEQLGIYEVDPEDFALCELIDSSKTDIQEIIRKGLDLMRKEMGE